MWKLSTAFFPCSKEAFTRTPGPSAGSSVTAAVQSEPSGAAGNDLRDGPDRTKAEALVGREPHHRRGSEGTLWDMLWGCPHCYCQLVLCLCCDQNCKSEANYWVNNEINALEGREVLWCFGTS